MKAIPKDRRTPNWNPDGPALKHCAVCGDNGWVEVNYRIDTFNDKSATVEEMAPCPYCLRGWRQEFPAIPKDGEKAKAWIRPPWNIEDGYWQGRDLPEHLVEHAVTASRPSRPLTMDEQRAALAAMVASVNLGSVDDAIEPVKRDRPPLVTNETADWASTYRYEPEPPEPDGPDVTFERLAAGNLDGQDPRNGRHNMSAKETTG